MRYFSCILVGLLLGSNCLAADNFHRSVRSPSIAVSLTVADPCLNSRHAEAHRCRGRFVQQVVETTQKLVLRTIHGEPVADGMSRTYRVRVIDFY